MPGPPTNPNPDFGDGVVTPHALFLAMHHEPQKAYDNLRKLQRNTPAPTVQGGFYDAIAVGSGRVAQRYLSLDQAMVLGSIGNVFGGEHRPAGVLGRGYPPHHPAVDRTGGVRVRARSEPVSDGRCDHRGRPGAVARPDLRGRPARARARSTGPIEVVRCAGGKPLNMARAARRPWAPTSRSSPCSVARPDRSCTTPWSRPGSRPSPCRRAAETRTCVSIAAADNGHADRGLRVRRADPADVWDQLVDAVSSAVASTDPGWLSISGGPPRELAGRRDRRAGADRSRRRASGSPSTPTVRRCRPPSTPVRSWSRSTASRLPTCWTCRTAPISGDLARGRPRPQRWSGRDHRRATAERWPSTASTSIGSACPTCTDTFRSAAGTPSWAVC